MSEEVKICSSCWEEDCVCDYEQYITLDAGIADVIVALNLKGYMTSYCCEGHIMEDDGSTQSKVMDIYLACPNHRFESLPEGFSYPKGKNRKDLHRMILYKYVKGKLCARIDGKYVPYELESDRQKHLDILMQWVETLPVMDLQQFGCYSEYLRTGRPKQSYLKYELPKSKTYSIVIRPEEYDNTVQHIVGYCGKILDIQESEGRIELRYWAEEDLFN